MIVELTLMVFIVQFINKLCAIRFDCYEKKEFVCYLILIIAEQHHRHHWFRANAYQHWHFYEYRVVFCGVSIN